MFYVYICFRGGSKNYCVVELSRSNDVKTLPKPLLAVKLNREVFIARSDRSFKCDCV